MYLNVTVDKTLIIINMSKICCQSKVHKRPGVKADWIYLEHQCSQSMDLSLSILLQQNTEAEYDYGASILDHKACSYTALCTSS